MIFELFPFRWYLRRDTPYANPNRKKSARIEKQSNYKRNIIGSEGQMYIFTGQDDDFTIIFMDMGDLDVICKSTWLLGLWLCIW